MSTTTRSASIPFCPPSPKPTRRPTKVEDHGAWASKIADRLLARTSEFMDGRIPYLDLETGNRADWKEAETSPTLLKAVQRVLRERLALAAMASEVGK